jgi:hypothetical protein
MRIRHPLIVLALAASSAWAASARAQGATAAEALFQDGQRLLKSGDVHGACLKFQESQRADPGIGTLINLATCHEQEGKTATAWSEFTDAASQAQRAGQSDREQFARGKASALERSLHKLVLEVLTPTPGMVIRLDGEPFGQGLLGTALPLDPGEHTLQVTAPGKKAWTQQVKMGPGAVTERIEVPALDDAAAATTTPLPATVATSAPTTDTAAPTTPSSSRKLVAYSVGGAGVAGVGLGVVFLIRSVLYSSKASDETSQLKTSTSPVDQATFTAAASSDTSAASANRTGAIIGLAAGGVAVGVGVYLLVTNKPAAAHASLDEPRRAGLYVPRWAAGGAPTGVGFAF